jgi:FkbM family methyltransferase
MFMKKFLDRIERTLIGKIRLQPFYESLHRISIRGMNYMQSQEIHMTGEIGAMTYAKEKRGSEQLILFDVGANTGQFARTMAKIFEQNFTLHSFEPSKRAYNELVKKTGNDDGHLIFHNVGFSDQEKQVSLFNSGSLFGTVYPLENVDKEHEEIDLITLDKFCREHAIKEIFYLKIDVEGAELDVLKGGQNMIESNKIRFIQFEFGPNNLEAKVSMKDFFKILKNYHIYRIVKNGLRRIEAYNEIIEIPLTSNFFAERKY